MLRHDVGAHKQKQVVCLVVGMLPNPYAHPLCPHWVLAQAAVYHQAAQLLHAQCSDQEQKLAAAHYAVLDWQLRCQGLTELAEEAAAALPTQSPEMRRFWAATLPAVQKRLAELGIAFC